ncbi:MAG: hypothetical protein CME98_23110 [Hyphomonas sp.]|nr:hypothetical protein [Hyphomonas sp.]
MKVNFIVKVKVVVQVQVMYLGFLMQKDILQQQTHKIFQVFMGYLLMELDMLLVLKQEVGVVHTLMVMLWD